MCVRVIAADQRHTRQDRRTAGGHYSRNRPTGKLSSHACMHGWCGEI